MTHPTSIFVKVVATLLFLSGLAHIFRPLQTECVMSKPSVVRSVGTGLLLLAIPCLVWRGWFYWTLLVVLAVSGRGGSASRNIPSESNRAATGARSMEFFS
jgi:hypothetical protein